MSTARLIAITGTTAITTDIMPAFHRAGVTTLPRKTLAAGFRRHNASNPELKCLPQTGLKIFEGRQQHAEQVAAGLK